MHCNRTIHLHEEPPCTSPTVEGSEDGRTYKVGPAVKGALHDIASTSRKKSTGAQIPIIQPRTLGTVWRISLQPDVRSGPGKHGHQLSIELDPTNLCTNYYFQLSWLIRFSSLIEQNKSFTNRTNPVKRVFKLSSLTHWSAYLKLTVHCRGKIICE